MPSRAIAAAVCGLALAPLGVHAQDWREVTSFRQRSDESRLDVDLRYGAGELFVQTGSPGELYRVALRYDADIFDPVTRYRNGHLEVGVEGRGRGVRLRNMEAGQLRLQLSPDVPLELDLDFGAVEANLDLGGLRIASLDIETGASETDIRFGAPNPLPCSRLDIAMGAAAVRAHGLANANCGHVSVEGGVGDLTLDFTGDWRRDLEASITMALGSVSLIIPDNVGVAVDKETFLTDFDRNRFHQRGDRYYSDNWESAVRRLTVRLEGAFGSMNVRWAPPASSVSP